MGLLKIIEILKNASIIIVINNLLDVSEWIYLHVIVILKNNEVDVFKMQFEMG